MKKETIEKVLKYGLDLNQWFILSCLKNGEDISSLFEFKKALGWRTLLEKKGYLEDGKLTQIASLLMENIGSNAPLEKTSLKDIVEGAMPLNEKVIFKEWVKGVHKKIQEELVKLTGRKQKYLKISGSNYGFLCGVLELETKLSSCMKKFGLTDLDKIEKLLIRHCKNDSPLIQYYILRERPNFSSPLATDYENFEDIMHEEKDNKEQKSSSIGGVFDI